MSADLDEKLARPTTTEGKARCRLKHLQDRLGYVVLAKDKDGPSWVAVDFMVRTTWRRLSGTQRGAEAEFELEGD